MTTKSYEFQLPNRFPGSEAFEVHISRAQKLQVARNFVVCFGTGVGLAFIGSLPFIHEFFLPFTIQEQTLGEWIFTIITLVMIMSAVSGIRIDLTRIFKENADRERNRRQDFEYDVLNVIRDNYPAAEKWSLHMLNGLTYHGATIWYERTDEGTSDVTITLTKTTVQLNVENRYPKPTLVKS